MDSTVAFAFEVLGVTVISLTSLPTCAEYSVTLPLKAGDSVPAESVREESELSPDFAGSELSGSDEAEPDTIICAPAAVIVLASAFT